MSSIDRYDWHLNENFPSNLPKENSATHIGFFVHWIIENNLINDEHKNDLTDGLQNVLNRKITGRDFLFNFLDGKLWFSDLNNEGKLFSEYYYLSNQYFDDYFKTLDNNQNSIFEYENSFSNYEKVKKAIDKNYSHWKKLKNF